MVVPYRDPSPDHYRRTAYDIGEWGLGFMTQSLELGCDCLGEIRYLDAVLHDTAGEPYTIANAVCIHEEDDGVLWKHVDHTEGAEVRRSRRLVISVHVTVANYEYLVYWRLYQDGSIECHVRATGIMVVGHLPEGEPARHGTLVDQRTYAPFHQHFLIARLDLDVDGPDNTVQMVETSAAGYSDEDPYGLACGRPPSRCATEGFQDYRWETQRAWKVTNPSSLNHVGDARRLQARPRRDAPAHAARRLPRAADRRGAAPHAVGDAVRRRRALALRAVPEPVEHRRGPAALDRGRPLDRGHRRRPLVRLRHPPHHAHGGLADHARGHGLVLAEAVRLLRPQPDAGRPAAAGALRALMLLELALGLALAPPCFGAASRDPEEPCVNDALRTTVTPPVAEARALPNSPCRSIVAGSPAVCRFGVRRRAGDVRAGG